MWRGDRSLEGGHVRLDLLPTAAKAHDPRELAAIYTALDRLLVGASNKLVERLFQREMRRPLY